MPKTKTKPKTLLHNSWDLGTFTYKKVLAWLATQAEGTSARRIQNYIQETNEYSQGACTVLAAQFITRGYRDRDIQVNSEGEFTAMNRVASETNPESDEEGFAIPGC